MILLACNYSKTMLSRVLYLSCLISLGTAWYQCDIFAERNTRSAQCKERLQERLHSHAKRKWRQSKPMPHMDKASIARCMQNKTTYFAGSSHTRTMLLSLIERITKKPQDSNLASRHKSCANLDGLDITDCGWPYSRYWVFGHNALLKKEATFFSPPNLFTDLNETSNEWRFVFQFKTFVSTPVLDQEIIRQLHEYHANLLVLEVGIWGWMPSNQNLAEHATVLLNTLRNNYTGTIILVIDGFNFGPVGPHIVNGSVIAPILTNVAQNMQDVLIFDRTSSLQAANKKKYLQNSMMRHGYAGEVADAHMSSLLHFICMKSVDQ